MKFLLGGVIVFQGLIHLIRYFNANDIDHVARLSQRISIANGEVWLIAAMYFFAAALLLMVESTQWIGLGFAAVVASQFLLILYRNEIRYGTIPNVIIMIAIVLCLGSCFFEEGYRKDITYNLNHNNSLSADVLTEQDLAELPAPVERYLKYAGVVGKPKVRNFRIVFNGEMRDKGQEYFSFTSEQYNFMQNPARLFFMKGRMFGITVPGYHKYLDRKASMDIRIFGMLPVVKLSGEVMDKTETVTLFNDMCLFSPASLIDDRIQWQAIDDRTVKAMFTNQGISITATLFFNQKGQLINFVSNDRTAVSDMKQYPFITPVSDYRNMNGINLPTYGEAIWRYPDGDFTYGKFRLQEIEYNLE